MHINCRCRIYTSLQNADTEQRTDHQPMTCPRVGVVLVPENTILFAPDSRLPVEGYK